MLHIPTQPLNLEVMFTNQNRKLSQSSQSNEVRLFVCVVGGGAGGQLGGWEEEGSPSLCQGTLAWILHYTSYISWCNTCFHVCLWRGKNRYSFFLEKREKSFTRRVL